MWSSETWKTLWLGQLALAMVVLGSSPGLIFTQHLYMNIDKLLLYKPIGVPHSPPFLPTWLLAQVHQVYFAIREFPLDLQVLDGSPPFFSVPNQYSLPTHCTSTPSTLYHTEFGPLVTQVTRCTGCTRFICTPHYVPFVCERAKKPLVGEALIHYVSTTITSDIINKIRMARPITARVEPRCNLAQTPPSS